MNARSFRIFCLLVATCLNLRSLRTRSHTHRHPSAPAHADRHHGTCRHRHLAARRHRHYGARCHRHHRSRRCIH